MAKDKKERARYASRACFPSSHPVSFIKPQREQLHEGQKRGSPGVQQHPQVGIPTLGDPWVGSWLLAVSVQIFPKSPRNTALMGKKWGWRGGSAKYHLCIYLLFHASKGNSALIKVTVCSPGDV